MRFKETLIGHYAVWISVFIENEIFVSEFLYIKFRPCNWVNDQQFKNSNHQISLSNTETRAIKEMTLVDTSRLIRGRSAEFGMPFLHCYEIVTTLLRKFVLLSIAPKSLRSHIIHISKRQRPELRNSKLEVETCVQLFSYLMPSRELVPYGQF